MPLIVDIQRCSLHDGPGIRTTVFLKGCPMRCLWCHNPEALVARPQIAFDRDKCVDCFACVQVCPHGAQQNSAGQHQMDHALCRVCGACLAVCTHDGLKLIGREMSVEQILAEVERDRDYYQRSGGGLTLSGGEPMAQFHASLELLAAAKGRGIHTCMETCGFAPAERYRQILPFVDLFLFDYKATDPVQHEALTGVSNELVLENLELLAGAGADIILRCPLVPGVNDSPEHLAAIAALARRLSQIRHVELMPYHNMGRDKARRIGREMTFPDLPTTDEPTRTRWLDALRSLGCTRVSVA